jgi:hypothetical protein
MFPRIPGGFFFPPSSFEGLGIRRVRFAELNLSELFLFLITFLSFSPFALKYELNQGKLRIMVKMKSDEFVN